MDKQNYKIEDHKTGETKMSGKLYVVGTPIGNLDDLSVRAAKTLESCDFIAAEDTRVTLKLLNHLNIKKPMISYFEHNKAQKGKIICDKISAGENCVLVSDAGMPAISDPGEELVRECHERGIVVTVIPGPSAVVSALAISGMSTGRFTFEGFLSVNKKRRKEHLAELCSEQRTMVFYEAPHKFLATLHSLLEAFGDREISIVRELTKVHEEIIRTTLAQAVERFENEKIRGEIVLIVAGKPQETETSMPLECAVQLARDFLAEGLSASEAAKKAAAETGLKKGEIYKQILMDE